MIVPDVGPTSQVHPDSPGEAVVGLTWAQLSQKVRRLELPRAQQALLNAMASHAQPDGSLRYRTPNGTWRYPRLSTLCTEARYGERTIREAHRKLRDRGLLRVEVPANRRLGKVAHYAIDVDAVQVRYEEILATKPARVLPQVVVAKSAHLNVLPKLQRPEPNVQEAGTTGRRARQTADAPSTHSPPHLEDLALDAEVAPKRTSRLRDEECADCGRQLTEDDARAGWGDADLSGRRCVDCRRAWLEGHDRSSEREAPRANDTADTRLLATMTRDQVPPGAAFDLSWMLERPLPRRVEGPQPIDRPTVATASPPLMSCARCTRMLDDADADAVSSSGGEPLCRPCRLRAPAAASTPLALARDSAGRRAPQGDGHD